MSSQPITGPELGHVLELAKARRPRGVTFDDTGSGAPKLKLPVTPEPGDHPGLCAWLTAVFNLNPSKPITKGNHEGLRGAAGHVVLTRMGAQPIRFEPASRINTPARLVEDLSWQVGPDDGPTYGFKSEHAQKIAHVVRMLCGASKAMTDEQETAGIVSVFLQAAEAVEGLTTYGTGPQRYEAAAALQRPRDAGTGRPLGIPLYLIDANTGEIVIRVQDLGDSARGQIGASLARGWLDARMENLAWTRVRLDGHAMSGRERVGNHHARVDVYRGLPLHDVPSSSEGDS